MNPPRRTCAALAVVMSAGCATGVDPNFALQIQAYQEVEKQRQTVALAKAQADASRYDAIARIAEHGDAQTRSMAMFALATGGDHAGALVEQPQQLPRVPESDADRAFKWTALFLGPLSNVAFGYFGYRLGVTQSNNAMNQSIASTNAFAATAGAGFASNAGIAQSGFNANASIAQSGFEAVGSLQPSISIGGNGAIATGAGSASFTTRNCPLTVPLPSTAPTIPSSITTTC